MKGKIVGFLRDYVLPLSIITLIIGLILMIMGAIYFLDVDLGGLTEFIGNLDGFNAYVFVIGLIIFGIGVYYLYSYLKKKKYLMEEIETNKRSEFLKKHNELKEIVRHLPSKYKTMLQEKERELNIK
jgi:formate hydrogenlyase subunit 3/multisubunit Na+/H+ antiporter MnhD subunit